MEGGQERVLAPPWFQARELLLLRTSLSPSEHSSFSIKETRNPHLTCEHTVTLHTCCAHHADTQGEAHL